jgi:hypothetical protein
MLMNVLAAMNYSTEGAVQGSWTARLAEGSFEDEQE